MVSFNILGAYFLIPATMFLTISFFVLYLLNKGATKELRNFGYFVVGLLWICALLAVAAGIFVMTKACRPWSNLDHSPKCYKMMQMHCMPGKMQGMPDKTHNMMMPMKDKMMSSPAMPGKQTVKQETATPEAKPHKMFPRRFKMEKKKIVIKKLEVPAKKTIEKAK